MSPVPRRGRRTSRRLAFALLAPAMIMAASGPAGAQVPAPGTPLASDPDANRLPPAPLNEQVVMLPGDPARPVSLQVTLMRPDGPGPFPLAIVLHGASGKKPPRQEPRYRASFLAYYFLSRGYAVAQPMLRGFGASGGDLPRHGCDVSLSGMENARDVAALIDALAALPGMDANRIVVAGQSYGGWAALAYATMARPGVKGIVNVVGGMRSSDCTHQDESLIATAAGFGARAKVPSLWFYGDNDTIFPPQTWRAVHQRYSAAGGTAELVAFGRFMDDSHQLLSHGEGLPVWTDRTDAFLARLGLPGRLIHPVYLPIAVPPPSHFAALTDAAAIPYLNDKGREQYAAFLKRPWTRAFVVSPNGIATSTDGGFDAPARALDLCRRYVSGCELYAVDDDVVWAKRDDAIHVARTVPGNMPTLLNFAFGVNPDCTSEGVPKLWTARPPEHGAIDIAQQTAPVQFPANHPFATCNGRMVPGITLRYTPAPGFTGADSLAFEEIDTDRRHLKFDLALTVR